MAFVKELRLGHLERPMAQLLMAYSLTLLEPGHNGFLFRYNIKLSEGLFSCCILNIFSAIKFAC